MPVLHLLARDPRQQHGVVDTLLIGVREQNLDLTNGVSIMGIKLINSSADDLLHHGDQGGDLVADVSVVTLGGGGVAGAGRGVGGGCRITNLESEIICIGNIYIEMLTCSSLQDFSKTAWTVLISAVTLRWS